MAEPSAWAVERAREIELSCSCESSGLLCPSHEQIALALDAAIADLEAEGVKLADEAIALRLTVEVRDQTIATLTAAIKGKDTLLTRITEGRGPFSRDQQEFAENVIEESKKLAHEALALTPASLRERVAGELAVIDAARLVVNQIICMGGEHAACNPCQNRDRLAAALAALAARHEAT